MISKRDEERAKRLVREAIERALSDMREYVNRALLDGGEPDRRMLVQMTQGLNALADEYALDLTAGPWGEMIEGAMKDAAAEVAKVAAAGGIGTEGFFQVGRREVETALFKSYGGIKGILAEGEQVVAEEVLRSVVGGASKREIATTIAERLQVADAAGDMGAIPAWRAELVARNELMANYRLTSRAAAEERGFTHYKMEGPDDDRTADDVCSRYLGEIHTPEEWERIGEKEGIDPAYPLMEYGFHVNCRHRWPPVPSVDAVSTGAELD